MARPAGCLRGPNLSGGLSDVPEDRATAMTSISAVSPAASLLQGGTQGCWQQLANGFAALQRALQSGDLWAAQQAFEALQQSALQTPGAGSTSSPDIRASSAFQALQNALSTGNLSAAQQAFAALQLEGIA